MPFWQQNAAQEWPRNGTAPTKDYYPRSVPVYDAQKIPPSMENPSSTHAGGGYRAVPLGAVVTPSFGRWDGLRGKLMEVSQADTYNSDPNPWPAAGTWEEPGGPIAASMLVRLQPTTSAHPGLAMSTGAGPTMLFHAPPVFSQQTTPIYGIGL